MAMAITQWCSSAARRMMGAMEQRMSYSSSAAAMGGPILCGRGDKRTKKGKRFKDSYGNSRPKKEKKIERIKDKVEVPRTLCSCVVCELLCIGARFYPVRTQRVAAARFPCHQNEGHCN